MKFSINLKDYREFIADNLFTFNLAVNSHSKTEDNHFHSHNWKILYEFIISSHTQEGHLISNKNALFDILRLHLFCLYDKAYDLYVRNEEYLLEQENEKRLIMLLLKIEFFEIYNLLRNNNILESFDQLEFISLNSAKRIKIEDVTLKIISLKRSKLLNLLKMTFRDVEYEILNHLEFQNNTESIYRDLLEFLIDVKCINPIGNKVSFSTTNFNHNFSKSFLNFFDRIKLCEHNFSDNQNSFELINLIHKNNFTSNQQNVSNNKKVKQKEMNQIQINSFQKNLVTDIYDSLGINDRLLSIEESLDSFAFDHKNNFKEYKEIDYNTKTIEQSHQNQFLLKMKCFNLLKTFIKKKRKNKQVKEKLVHKEKTAVYFSNTLLKSKSFYALLKRVKQLKYSNIVHNNFIEYQQNHHSKLFLKCLIHGFNRKKLVESFKYFRSMNKVKAIFKQINQFVKFKSNHKRLYISRLLNNEFCIKFILFLNTFLIHNSQLLKLNIQVKSKWPSNYKKFKNMNEFFNKKNIFKELHNNKMYSFDYNMIMEKKSNEFRIKTFSYSFRKYIIYIKKQTKVSYSKSKYNKKIFLLRYYLKKFIKESIMKKLSTCKNIIGLMMFKNNFKRLIKLSKENIKDSFAIQTSKKKESHYLTKIKANSFTLLKKYTLMRKKINFLNNKKNNIAKSLFFRNSKIKLIEGLVIQALLEKVKIYLKNKLLITMLTFSINNLKITKFSEARLKRKIFGLFKSIKIKKNNLVNATVKFYVNLMINKIKHINSEKQNKHNKINNFKINFDKQIFFKLIITSILRSKKVRDIKIKFINKSKKTFYKKMKMQVSYLNSSTSISNKTNNLQNSFRITDRKKVFQIRTFLVRVLLLSMNSEKIKLKLKSFFYRKFTKRLNLVIQNHSFKIFSNNLKKSKISKRFFSLVLSSSRTNKNKQSLTKIRDKYFHKIISEIIISTSQNLNIDRQLYVFLQIKKKKMILGLLKKYYMDKIKYYMLGDRFKEYLLIKSLNKLSVINK